MKSIILIAPPAAGKGTVSFILKEKYHIPHISTGDLLREAVRNNNEFGMLIKETQEKGLLVSDEIVLKLLKNRISDCDCNNGYILDGFPRTINQAVAYEKILADLNKKLGIVILLEVDKELAKNRITGRVSCAKCNAIYNNKFADLKPKVENICDKCNSELTHRSDDNEEAFNQRFDIYLEKTTPLINYYENKNILYRVDSNHGSDSAVATIEEIIK
ncbi:MAG: adenylate kinase [Erysipelotrichaceae bacterium]